jgi:hypothetical protein
LLEDANQGCAAPSKHFAALRLQQVRELLGSHSSDPWCPGHESGWKRFAVADSPDSERGLAAELDKTDACRMARQSSDEDASCLNRAACPAGALNRV